MATQLQHPDSFYLDAAQGWLGLGDHVQANEELEQISPTMRAHPDVLAVRYDVKANIEAGVKNALTNTTP